MVQYIHSYGAAWRKGEKKKDAFWAFLAERNCRARMWGERVAKFLDISLEPLPEHGDVAIFYSLLAKNF